VPIVVAITKTDKRNANIERVKQELAELDLVPDEWDGDTLMIPVSAQKGEGIEDLLEALLLVADDNRIVANPKAEASGVVIESRVDPSRGTVATLLVLNGTMKRGDVILAGKSLGRIKAMFDDALKPVEEATPSMPVQILGLNEPPQPGTRFGRAKNEKEARALVAEMLDNARVESTVRSALTLEDLFAQYNAGMAKELTLILKVDVQGSLQPVVDSLNDIKKGSKDGVGLKILAADVGNVSENDVNLAAASHAIILGFNVDIDNPARKSAEAQHVEIRSYTIIYKLLEDIELALKGMLDPVYAPKQIGAAEVRQVFRISKIGAIAGSYIREGEARRNAKARVRRAGKLLIEETTVSSLKRFNEDVREVRSGFECGIGLNNFNEFEEGDIIEFFVMERVN
jgi:translation initiation factor IF-2